MSTTPVPSPPTPGLLRVTVHAGQRRGDLALPAVVPLGELLPELARLLGLLDDATVHDGFRLVGADGLPLAAGEGLAAQGVEDGALLALLPGTPPPPRVYDDPAEALGDAVARDVRSWSPAAARPAAVAAGALLVLLDAVTLLAQRGTPAGALAPARTAAVVAAALVLGVVVAARTCEPTTAVTCAWLGVGQAGVAAALATPGGALRGAPTAWAGGAACLTCLGCLAALGPVRHRGARLLPPATLGLVLLATGLLTRWAGADPEVVLTTVLVLLVLAGSVFPWLALGVGGRHVERSTGPLGPAGLDPVPVGDAARSAHDLLAALTVTVGVLLVLAAPSAVRLGAAGTAIALLACLATALRTRQYAARATVAAGLVAAVLGLASTSIAVVVLHPGWRAVAALPLAGTGLLLLAAGARPAVSSLRLARLGDLAEAAALLAMLPLLVVAAGLLSWVRG